MAAAGNDYTPGSMDIETQKSTWSGFMTVTWWGSLLTALVTAYLVFVFGVGADWLVSLIGVTLFGGVLGLAMGMGRAWYGTLFSLFVLAVIVRLIIGLWQLAL